MRHAPAVWLIFSPSYFNTEAKVTSVHADFKDLEKAVLPITICLGPDGNNRNRNYVFSVDVAVPNKQQVAGTGMVPRFQFQSQTWQIPCRQAIQNLTIPPASC
jgi:hypothetical protein